VKIFLHHPKKSLHDGITLYTVGSIGSEEKATDPMSAAAAAGAFDKTPVPSSLKSEFQICADNEAHDRSERSLSVSLPCQTKVESRIGR
jgi:hypothetical protein